MTDTAMLALVGVVIAALSLGVSATTMYFAWLRRGRLAMTKPTVVFFGYDFVPKPTPKVFVRMLLYSTSPKGKMVERMYVKVLHKDSEQVFGFWGHGLTNELTPGSGLFVGQTGHSANHHFVLSVHHPGYEFGVGENTIQIFAQEAGQPTAALLSEVKVTLDAKLAAALASHQGVLFEQQPDTLRYFGHVRDHSPA